MMNYSGGQNFGMFRHGISGMDNRSKAWTDWLKSDRELQDPRKS